MGDACPDSFECDLALSQSVSAVAFNHSGTLIAVGTSDHVIVVVDALTKTVVRTIHIPHADDANTGDGDGLLVTTLAWSADDERIICGVRGDAFIGVAIAEVRVGHARIARRVLNPIRSVSVYDANTDVDIFLVCDSAPGTDRFVAATTEPTLFVARNDGAHETTAIVIRHDFGADETDNKRERTVVAVFAPASPPSPPTVFAISSRLTLSAYELTTADAAPLEVRLSARTAIGHALRFVTPLSASVSARGHILISCSDGVIRVIAPAHAILIAELTDAANVNRIAFRTAHFIDDTHIASATSGYKSAYDLHIWNLTTAALVRVLTCSNDEVTDMAVHARRPHIAVATRTGRCSLWTKHDHITHAADAADFVRITQNTEFIEDETQFDAPQLFRDDTNDANDDETALDIVARNSDGHERPPLLFLTPLEPIKADDVIASRVEQRRQERLKKAAMIE